MASIRPITTITALGLAVTAWTAGIATAADLLQAPSGPEASDPGAWTPVVARSYEQHYSDVQCLTLPAPADTAATYDLGTAPSGEWFFAVVETEIGTHQYGPVELTGTQVPAGAGATGVIGCHGTPVTTGGDAPTSQTAEADAAQPAGSPVDGAPTSPPMSAAPAAVAPASSAPSPSGTPSVPATVTSGLQGGRSGLVVLGVGAVLVAGLALLGRRARR